MPEQGGVEQMDPKLRNGNEKGPSPSLWAAPPSGRLGSGGQRPEGCVARGKN